MGGRLFNFRRKPLRQVPKVVPEGLTFTEEDGGGEIGVVPKVRPTLRVVESMNVTDLEVGGGPAKGHSATRDHEPMPVMLHDHLLLLVVLVRPLHAEEPREELNEDPLDPGRHFVSGRRAIVDIQNTNGDNDRECDQCHCEEEVFAEEGDCKGGRRDDFCEEEDEDSEGEEDGDAEGHLLARVRREVEDEHGEERDPHAGNDKVHHVVQRLPTENDAEDDVDVGLFRKSAYKRM